MISVALVLLLTLAMGLIFRTTSETISKATALNQTVRNLDAATKTMQVDIPGTDTIDRDPFTDDSGILPSSEAPFLIITSQYAATWPNQAAFDADARANYDPTAPTLVDWYEDALTVDLDNDGEEAGNETTLQSALGLLGRRAFRTDTIGFFSRGVFSSQTGQNGAFTTPIAKENAFIWYGHLRLFNNDYSRLDRSDAHGAPGLPLTQLSFSGSGLNGLENVNNRFADQFALGRMAILLSDFNATVAGSPTPNTIVDDNGSFINFLWHAWRTPTDGTNTATSPLTYASLVRFGTNPGTGPGPQESGTDVTAYRARYDVAGVTATQFRERLTFLTNPAAPLRRPYVPGDVDGRMPQAPSFASTWWYDLFASYNQRFWANPFGQSPFDAKTMSQRFHYLVPAARQFAVEYAGDYFTQDNNPANATYGDVLQVEPDGIVDFVITLSGARQTRFYGFPRDVDGDGLFAGLDDIANSTDVAPLRTVARAFLGNTIDLDGWPGGSIPASFPHEKLYPLVAPPAAYGVDALTTPEPFRDTYTCAWGPTEFDGTNAAPFDFNLSPKLIRIVIEATDTGGRLEEALSTEVVFRVPD